MAAAVVGLAMSARVNGTAAEFSWRTSEDQVALVHQSGAPVWQFNFPAAPVKPHFHPVGLPGKPALTWKAPPDHIWHLGLWFSWKFINGRNYWEVDSRTGRSEGLTRVVAVRPVVREDWSARIEVEIAYQPKEDEAAVLREKRTIEISAPADDGSYTMDWTMTFTAGAETVRLDRTPLPHEENGKPWGGYAGLIWRFAKEFTEWQAVNAEGKRNLAAHGARAQACDFSGVLAGEAMGVAMIDHPENLRSPTPWYVTMERETPFACVMPSPLFRDAYELRAGDGLTLRYRVLVHPGQWDAGRLEAERRRYIER